MQSVGCLAASCYLMRDACGELISCVGIDVQASIPAPLGKCFGVDKGADDCLSFATKTFLSSFGGHPPEVVAGMQLLPVLHDREAGIVFLRFVPDHADDLHA